MKLKQLPKAKSRNHPIIQLQPVYANAPRQWKIVMATIIVEELVAMDPPSRFVQLVPKTCVEDRKCFLVTAELAIEKVCQALREQKMSCPAPLRKQADKLQLVAHDNGMTDVISRPKVVGNLKSHAAYQTLVKEQIEATKRFIRILFSSKISKTCQTPSLVQRHLLVPSKPAVAKPASVSFTGVVSRPPTTKRIKTSDQRAKTPSPPFIVTPTAAAATVEATHNDDTAKAKRATSDDFPTRIFAKPMYATQCNETVQPLHHGSRAARNNRVMTAPATYPESMAEPTSRKLWNGSAVTFFESWFDVPVRTRAPSLPMTFPPCDICIVSRNRDC
ncbi:hypothetical protein MPSEU_000353000 [Mayamaea pseudoterrestris]|nr:hypothetical protein MPSEU_000353000 [Mayamaea pseudoterrestris]